MAKKNKLEGAPEIPGRQPARAEIKVDQVKWKAFHLATLEQVYRLKGKNPPCWDPSASQTDLGHLGDLSYVETPCVRCCAQRVEIVPGGIVCVICGTSTINEDEQLNVEAIDTSGAAVPQPDPDAALEA